MTAARAADRRALDWLLAEFTRGTPGVRHALVGSGDGVPLASSGRVGVDAERGAAIIAGLVGLAHAVARSFGGGRVRQVIVQLAGGCLFITMVGGVSTLGVVADRQCDVGMIAYEMAMLAERVGDVLAADPHGAARLH